MGSRIKVVVSRNIDRRSAKVYRPQVH